MPTTPLANEWTVLQNQCDSYEKHALWIKLVAIVLVAGTLWIEPANVSAVLALTGILWLQDAIWKTFQHRFEMRLLRIEKHLAGLQSGDADSGVAYQFNTDFVTRRRSGGVLKEYVSQALRPTVAFPYAVLVLVLVATTVSH